MKAVQLLDRQPPAASMSRRQLAEHLNRLGPETLIRLLFGCVVRVRSRREPKQTASRSQKLFASFRERAAQILRETSRTMRARRIDVSFTSLNVATAAAPTIAIRSSSLSIIGSARTREADG